MVMGELRCFILGTDRAVWAVDVMTWARWFEEMSRPDASGDIPRRVAHDVIGEYSLSTVFIGVDAGCLFETMAFGPCEPAIVFGRTITRDELHDFTDRYDTWDAAAAGHAAALDRLRQRLGTLSQLGAAPTEPAVSPEPTEFDCADCGVHVYAFGLTKVPEPPRCATCQWLAELPEPERSELRETLKRWDA